MAFIQSSGTDRSHLILSVDTNPIDFFVMKYFHDIAHMPVGTLDFRFNGQNNTEAETACNTVMERLHNAKLGQHTDIITTTVKGHSLLPDYLQEAEQTGPILRLHEGINIILIMQTLLGGNESLFPESISGPYSQSVREDNEGKDSLINLNLARKVTAELGFTELLPFIKRTPVIQPRGIDPESIRQQLDERGSEERTR